ncbi:MAG: homoserine O-acetyltransferase/O-succinyltransferase [Thermoleophilaceae bacterium]|jgi:homoserine O-acetyltransferase|nr:homoserine O-acetyltransferase/O-succinyltransferase [Thermoleophilaceae bacterium]
MGPRVDQLQASALDSIESAGIEVFEAGDVELQHGGTLVDARLAFRVHGRLNETRDNVILYPTRFGGTADDNEFLIGERHALDPTRYCIVIPNLLGNGISSSPSNSQPPSDGARFPLVTIYDNVRLQHRLLTEELGVNRIALAVGWSMGAQQAYHWAVLYPELVERLAAICGSARTSPHNHVFLEGVKAALTADPAWEGGEYERQPEVGLRAMGRVWAGWGFSQAWYRNQLHRAMGSDSLEDFLAEYESMFLARDANNMLAMIATWQASDISANDGFHGDFERALAAIDAPAVVMPGATDLYFHADDSEYEVRHMRRAELRPIPSIWGHYAGGGRDPEATAFIDDCLRELLAG